MKYKLFAHVYDRSDSANFKAGEFCVEHMDEIISIKHYGRYVRIVFKDGTEHHFMERKFYLEIWSKKIKGDELGLVDYHREGGE